MSERRLRQFVPHPSFCVTVRWVRAATMLRASEDCRDARYGRPNCAYAPGLRNGLPIESSTVPQTQGQCTCKMQHPEPSLPLLKISLRSSKFGVSFFIPRRSVKSMKTMGKQHETTINLKTGVTATDKPHGPLHSTPFSNLLGVKSEIRGIRSNSSSRTTTSSSLLPARRLR